MTAKTPFGLYDLCQVAVAGVEALEPANCIHNPLLVNSSATQSQRVRRSIPLYEPVELCSFPSRMFAVEVLTSRVRAASTGVMEGMMMVWGLCVACFVQSQW